MPTVIILAGGRGTRLKEVTQDKMPKPMVPVPYQGVNYPFISFLLHRLRNQGIRQVVICVDHQAEQFVSYFGNGEHYGIEILYDEAGHVKTGSRVRHAMNKVKGSEVIIHCGDVYHPLNMRRFLDGFAEHPDDKMQIAVQGQLDGMDILPNIEIDKNQRIVGYKTPGSEKTRLVLGTCVLAVRREVMSYLPQSMDFSLTKDLYPILIARNLVGAYQSKAAFHEVGNPDGYLRFCQYVENDGIQPLLQQEVQCV